MPTATLDPDALRLNLGDVALLAQVRRPVVSTWRSRSAGSDLPFPRAVASTRGREVFDGDEVVTWLEATGRGHNPSPRSDLPTVASLAGAPIDDDVVVDGLNALLCLHAHADGLPRAAEDVLDLADEADPDDEYLFTELEALGERLPTLARYVCLRVEADYGVAAAFDTLAAARRRACGETGCSNLSADAMALVVGLAASLAAQSGDGAYALVDPTGVGDLAVEVARRRIDAGDDCSVAVPSSAATSAPAKARRSLLRRLAVHGVPRDRARPDGGSRAVPSRSLAVVHLTPGTDGRRSDADVLQALDEAVLETPGDQTVMVLGPASVMVDRLVIAQDRPGRPRRDASVANPASAVRDGILRSQRVRCIVRLPAGLDRSRPRARTALWCLGPPTRAPRESAPVLVADLANVALDPAATSALVADLVAGTAGGRTWRSHAPTFLREVLVRDLLASGGDLVRPARAKPPTSLPAALASEVGSLAEQVRADLPPVVLPAVRTRSDPAGVGSTTVEAAMKRGDLLVRPGVRMVGDDLSGGGVPVIGPSDLDRLHAPTRHMDRFTMAAQYPRASTTEPGDVIFTTSPRPRAVVDVAGGSLVAAPAQVLRCVDPALLPAVLVTDVNAQSPTARTWRAWRIRQVPSDQAGAVTTALDRITAHAEAARERLATLDRLATVLVEGATSGVLDLLPTD